MTEQSRVEQEKRTNWRQWRYTRLRQTSNISYQREHQGFLPKIYVYHRSSYLLFTRERERKKNVNI